MHALVLCRVLLGGSDLCMHLTNYMYDLGRACVHPCMHVQVSLATAASSLSGTGRRVELSSVLHMGHRPVYTINGTSQPPDEDYYQYMKYTAGSASVFIRPSFVYVCMLR